MTDEFIPLSVPNLKGNELKYVTEAVETEWVSTGGPYVSKFERNIAEYLNVDGAVSCQNGTSGIHLCLIDAGIGLNDAVIVPTLTFIAAVNPIKYVNATPIFLDCDDSLCLDPIKVENFIISECTFEGNVLRHLASGKTIKAIIVVHIFGNMASMVSLTKICKKYNLILIEDSTEALGTKFISGPYKELFAGTIGDYGVYSFNGNKILTTGGGGMIVSKSAKSLNHIKHLSTQAKADELNFIHDEIGYNYRMTNIQAALGLAQLEQLESFINIKRHNYFRYKQELDKISGLYINPFSEEIRPNYWFYALVCDHFSLDRDELINYLGKNSIQARPIWGLIHEQKPYKNSITSKIDVARYYWERVVNIPCSSNLTVEKVNRVISKIKAVG